MTLKKAISYFKGGERAMAEFMGINRVSLNQVRNNRKNSGPLLTLILRHYGIEIKAVKYPIKRDKRAPNDNTRGDRGKAT